MIMECIKYLYIAYKLSSLTAVTHVNVNKMQKQKDRKLPPFVKWIVNVGEFSGRGENENSHLTSFSPSFFAAAHISSFIN